MPAAGLLKSFYLRYLSKPACDRSVYTLIRRHRIRNIVELGVGHGQRAANMIALAQRYHDSEVRYAGIDLFEARSDAASGLSLKQAYKQLRATGAKVQLVPGDPFSSLARTANNLTGTELLLVSADQDAASLERAWFYVPRMLAEHAVVLVECPADNRAKHTFQRMSRIEIERLAGAKQQRQRAA